MTAPTPDELTAIEAASKADLIGLREHPSYYGALDKRFIRDIRLLLAALRTEQDARARVEAAARDVLAFGKANRMGPAYASRAEALDALRAALAAQEGET